MAKKQPKPDFQKWDCWQNNLSKIKDELERMDYSRRIFSKVWDVICQNSELKKHLKGDYINWLTHNYCVRLGMSIRRLVERGGKAPSIQNLLDDIEIEKNISQINTDNLAKYFLRKKQNPSKSYKEEEYYNVALRNYEKALGPNREKLLPEDLRNDKGLVCLATKIKDYVDKNWAHRDRAKVCIPTIDESHKCLDDLIRICKRYSLLLGGGEFELFQEKFLNDWDAPLRILWVN